MEATQLTLRLVVGALVLLIPGLLTAKQKDPNTIASIKQTLESRYPKMKIVDVQPAPIPSLYEVFTGKSIVYTDKTADHLIDGPIYDTSSKKDLTEDRINERNAISFGSLPFDQAIKIVKGNGERKVAIFSDPDCPYCKKLEEEMKPVTDLTEYVFLFPLTKLHPNAERHAKSIWCSADRAQAWSDWLLERKEPAGAVCEGDPVGSLRELGEKLNVAGTPTMYFENGQRAAGAMSTADFENRLAQATGTKEKGTQGTR